jgi:hypothetical protein
MRIRGRLAVEAHPLVSYAGCRESAALVPWRAWQRRVQRGEDGLDRSLAVVMWVVTAEFSMMLGVCLSGWGGVAGKWRRRRGECRGTTSSATSTAARAVISRSTTSAWPLEDAAISGVEPSCDTRRAVGGKSEQAKQTFLWNAKRALP